MALGYHGYSEDIQNLPAWCNQLKWLGTKIDVPVNETACPALKSKWPGCSDTVVATFSSMAPARRPAELLKLASPIAVYSVTWSTRAFVSTKPSVRSSLQWGFKTIAKYHSTISYYPAHSSGIADRERGRGEKQYMYRKFCDQLHERVVMETLSVPAAMPCAAGPKEKEQGVPSSPASTSMFSPV